MDLKKHFDKYDASNDGIIELHEFKAAMQEANYSEEDIERMFSGIVSFECSPQHLYTSRLSSNLFFPLRSILQKDVNHSGMVEYTEFLASAIEAFGMVEEERIAEAFDQLDADNSGSISKAELLSFLGRDAEGDEASSILNEWDTDGDGMSKLHDANVVVRNDRDEF